MKKLVLSLVALTILGCKSNEKECIPCKAEIEKSWHVSDTVINGNSVLLPSLIETRYYFYDYRDGKTNIKMLDTVQISKEDYEKIDFPVCKMDTIKKYGIY